MQNLYEQHVKVEEELKEKLFIEFLEFLKNEDISYAMSNFMFRKIDDNLEMNLSDLITRDDKINYDFLNYSLDEVADIFADELFNEAESQFLAECSEELIIKFVKFIETNNYDQFFYYVNVLKNEFWSTEDWESYVDIDINSKAFEGFYTIPVEIVVNEGNLEASGTKLSKSLRYIKQMIDNNSKSINEEKIDNFTKELFKSQGCEINDILDKRKYENSNFLPSFRNALNYIDDRIYYIGYSQLSLTGIIECVERNRFLWTNDLSPLCVCTPDSNKLFELFLDFPFETKLTNLVLSNQNNPSFNLED